VNDILAFVITAAACYFIGSLSFAVVFSKKRFGRDVRESGSGNAGTTNMIRTFGWKAGLTVFVADALKGAAGVLVGKVVFSFFGADALIGAYIGGIITCIGHIFPIFFNFKGGKGVATAIGSAIIIHPFTVFILLLLGVGIAAVSGFVSLGSITAVGIFPFAMWALFGVREFFLALLLAAPVIICHRENIIRLIEKRENKFAPPSDKPKN